MIMVCSGSLATTRRSEIGRSDESRSGLDVTCRRRLWLPGSAAASGHNHGRDREIGPVVDVKAHLGAADSIVDALPWQLGTTEAQRKRARGKVSALTHQVASLLAAAGPSRTSGRHWPPPRPRPTHRTRPLRRSGGAQRSSRPGKTGRYYRGRRGNRPNEAGILCPGHGRQELTVSQKPNQDEQQAAVREAKAQGKRPSEVGATTGASKQIDHHTNTEREHEDTPRGGKS